MPAAWPVVMGYRARPVRKVRRGDSGAVGPQGPPGAQGPPAAGDGTVHILRQDNQTGQILPGDSDFHAVTAGLALPAGQTFLVTLNISASGGITAFQLRCGVSGGNNLHGTIHVEGMHAASLSDSDTATGGNTISAICLTDDPGVIIENAVLIATPVTIN